MNKKTIIYALGLLLCVWSSLSLHAAQPARPRLVIGLVVDQMRWDYLYYYDKIYSSHGGINRLMAEGFSCNNARIDYVPTITACGHSTIYTGATPAITGIAGNSFIANGRMVTSVTDPTVQTVGSKSTAGQCSPRLMRTTTVGDQLRLATDFESRVVGVALKDRASILPAGHSANAAYWYDRKEHRFITSTYYTNKLPDWVAEFNRKNAKDLAGNLVYSWRGVPITFEMAKQAIEHEKLGTEGRTDMLTISISSTDMTAHQYGTRSPETDSVYLALDSELGKFLSYLDAQIGRGNYLLFLTADHGGTNNYAYNSAHHLPTGAWNAWARISDLNRALKTHFHVDSLAVAVNEFNVYLNHEQINRSDLDRDDVAHEAIKWLQTEPEVDLAVDYKYVAQAPIPQDIKERIIKGYNHERSGDIFVLLYPGYYAGQATKAGSNHGTWSMQDTHIPLVWYGWNINHGETAVPCNMTDIAATLAALLHIQEPNGCIGKPIPAIVP